MGTVWDDEMIFKLIEVFETKRILWDCATWSKDYKNKIKKNDAWEEIAETLGISKLDVESKMRSLRSQFARERKKILSLKTTGIPDAEICKWKYYDALKFLTSGTRSSGLASAERLDHTAKTVSANKNSFTSHHNLSLFSEKANIFTVKPVLLADVLLKLSLQIISVIQASIDPLEIELKDSSIASTCSSPEPQPSPQSSSSNHKSLKRKVDDNLDEIYDIVKSAKRKMGCRDEFDIYGQYVASELREAKDEHSTLKAKSLINNILFDMRMGKYKNAKNAVPLKME